MTEPSFPHERILVTLDEFMHDVTVETRVYETRENMRRAAMLDLLESRIRSDSLDDPIGEIELSPDTAGVTVMNDMPIDPATGVTRVGTSPMATIYLNKPDLDVRVVSHECVHTALGLYREEILDNRSEEKAEDHVSAGNELIAYVQSDLLEKLLDALPAFERKEPHDPTTA